MEQREQRALQTEFSSGRARMAAAGRTLRSGLAAMTAALTPQRPRQRAAAEQQGTDGPERQAETSAPVREVVFVDGPRSPGRQAERSAPVREVLFETATPEKPRRSVPARASDVVAMSASGAAVAQGQHGVTADAPEEYARAQGVSVVEVSVTQEQRVVDQGTTAGDAQKQASVAREQRVVAAGALAGMAQVQSSQDSAGMAQEQSVVPEDASAGGARAQASVALEQRVMGAGTSAVGAQVQSNQDGAVVQGDSMAQMLQVLQQMRAEVQQVQKQVLQQVQESQAEMRADVRAVVQSVRTEVLQMQDNQAARTAALEQRVLAVETNQAQLHAKMIGVSVSLERLTQGMERVNASVQHLNEVLAQETERAIASVQQLREEQEERLEVVEQQLQMLQEVPLAGNQTDNEERLFTIEQRLIELEVDPAEHERQQRLEKRLNIVDQQRQNEHARQLEEQARLLQELRDEQERLRDEQEKLKNNEKRICAKIEQFVRASADLVKKEAFDPLLAKYEQGTNLVLKGTGATSPAALPSLAEMFKAKPGEWDCANCWTRNKPEAQVKCMSCEEYTYLKTPKEWAADEEARKQRCHATFKKWDAEKAAAKLVGAPAPPYPDFSEEAWKRWDAEKVAARLAGAPEPPYPGFSEKATANSKPLVFSFEPQKATEADTGAEDSASEAEGRSQAWAAGWDPERSGRGGLIPARSQNPMRAPSFGRGREFNEHNGQQRSTLHVGGANARALSKISDEESDDDEQQRAPESDWSMECCRVEIKEPESFQFRDAFEAGREQAHEDIAFQEGYQYGASEAAANWEIEREMAGPYSSACVTDSMLSEREAEWSTEEETRSGDNNEREAEWRAEEETRSHGSNERGAENSEEDWRDTQWDENGEIIYGYD